MWHPGGVTSVPSAALSQGNCAPSKPLPAAFWRDARQVVIAIHKHVAGQLRLRKGEHGQHKDLGLPEDVVTIAEPTEGFGADARAFGPARRSNDQMKDVETHGQLCLDVALDHHIQFVPDARPGCIVGGRNSS